jgi:hypothetical protein
MSTVPQTTPWGDNTPMGVRFRAATGTSDVALQETLIRQLRDTFAASPKLHPVDKASLEDAAVAALTALEPQDASEGMQAVQIVATEITAMDCLKRAADPGATLAVRDVNLRHAEKLMMVNLRLQEALDRRRGRGPVSVTAGNVLNVQPGGQAVVSMQAHMGQAEADAGATHPAQGHHPGETGDPGQGRAPVVNDERIKRSAVAVPQEERIKRPPVPSDERIVRRV